MEETRDHVNESSTVAANFTSTVAVNVTTTEKPTYAPEVDTVIVIIWAIGGALLITLIVLMVCILRSHQKSRRNRTNGDQTRGNPRHGGVNHGFSTNYDEIWTWIPVINDAQARCPSQINPSARESSSQRESSSHQQQTLLNNLRLPTYNEAVRNKTTNQSRGNQMASRPGHVINTGSGVVTPNRREERSAHRAVPVRLTSSAGASPDHHYETIQHDRVATSRQQGQSFPISNVTSVNMTSSRDAPIIRCETRNASAVRTITDQASRGASSRLPPIPSVQSTRAEDFRIVSGNVGPNASGQATRTNAGVRTSVQPTQTLPDSIYPIMGAISTQSAFQHSTSSVFNYCGNHGNQLVFSDIPPSVSAIYEAPTLQVRGVASSGNHEPSGSVTQNTRDALRRLESEYF